MNFFSSVLAFLCVVHPHRKWETTITTTAAFVPSSRIRIANNNKYHTSSSSSSSSYSSSRHIIRAIPIPPDFDEDDPRNYNNNDVDVDVEANDVSPNTPYFAKFPSPGTRSPAAIQLSAPVPLDVDLSEEERIPSHNNEFPSPGTRPPPAIQLSPPVPLDVDLSEEERIPSTNNGLELTAASLLDEKISRRYKPDPTPSSVVVQGGSLKTWPFPSPDVERVKVKLSSEGRSLSADVDVWYGPNNKPFQLNIFSEDGTSRPFYAIIETPRTNNAIAVRNTGSIEFPLEAEVTVDVEGIAARTASREEFRKIQGGTVDTYPFPQGISRVTVSLTTDGRPMHATIELLQGPNNKKEVVQVYAEDGRERPFVGVFETPGPGNVIRIVNLATLEYPLQARVEACEMDPGFGDGVGDDGSLLKLGQGRSGWSTSPLF